MIVCGPWPYSPSSCPLPLVADPLVTGIDCPDALVDALGTNHEIMVAFGCMSPAIPVGRACAPMMTL